MKGEIEAGKTNNMSQQTAVDFLVSQIGPFLEMDKEEAIKVIEQAKEMEKEQSHNYADFCVRCDRDQMKLLDFNDYMKIYTNGL